MNINLDLYSAVELRAFATFLATVADAYDKAVKDNENINYGTLGGINRASNATWQNRQAEAGEGGQTEPLVLDEKAFLGETQANTNTAPTRKRGEPSPGHKRRTKAEIAEDEAAAAAETKSISPEAFAEMAAISTGGERVAPDDEPEVEQQDVADEADETAKAGAELSHENLRDSLGKYVQRFGMDAAQLDGPKLFALVFKNPAITKISAVPSDQASLKAALDGINEMLAKNPFDRSPVA